MNDIMEDGDMESESDENTDKIINEMEAQVNGGGNGGMVQKQKEDPVIIFVSRVILRD
jgi:hypothetical protein